jgi:hypothetical protein
MDRAVLQAYGWNDLSARAAPIFFDEENEDGHTYQGRLFWPSTSARKSSPSTLNATPKESAWASPKAKKQEVEDDELTTYEEFSYS